MKVNKKVLHVSTDNKFIEGAKNTFKDIFEENTFLILKPPFLSLKFVKNDNNTITKNYYSFIYNLKSKFYEKFDFIVLHDMNYFNSRLVLKHPGLNYIYLGWGYEIYNNDYILNNFSFMLKFGSPSSSANIIYKSINLISNLLKFGILNIDYNNQKIIFKAINRITKIGLLESEFEMFKTNNILNGDCKLTPPFAYNPSKKIKNFNKKFKDNNIIVGNCSAIEIGHLDIFNLISNLDFNKVLVPLSYGNFDYREKVINFGKVLFSERFIPIVNFKSLIEYRQFFKTASYYIDNSRRQRGFGNIILCLEFGVKIFLNQTNPVYSHVKNLGGYIWTIDEISNYNLKPLTQNESLKNSSIVDKFYLRDKIIMNWQFFLK